MSRISVMIDKDKWDAIVSLLDTRGMSHSDISTAVDIIINNLLEFEVQKLKSFTCGNFNAQYDVG